MSTSHTGQVEGGSKHMSFSSKMMIANSSEGRRARISRLSSQFLFYFWHGEAKTKKMNQHGFAAGLFLHCTNANYNRRLAGVVRTGKVLNGLMLFAHLVPVPRRLVSPKQRPILLQIPKLNKFGGHGMLGGLESGLPVQHQSTGVLQRSGHDPREQGRCRSAPWTYKHSQSLVIKTRPE